MVASTTTTTPNEPARTVILGPDKIGPNSNAEYAITKNGFKPPAHAVGLKNQWGHELIGRLLKCVVEIAPGVSVRAYAWDNYIFVDSNSHVHGNYGSDNLNTHMMEIVDVDPFVTVTPIGNAYHKTVMREVRSTYWGSTTKQSALDVYGEYRDYGGRGGDIPGIPWNYLKVLVTAADGTSAECECKFVRPEAGVIDLDAFGASTTGRPPTVFRASHTFFGLNLTWEETLHNSEQRSWSDERWPKAWRLLKRFEIKQGKAALWERFLGMYESRARLTKGVKAAEQKKGIRENLERLKSEEKLLWDFYAWLHDEKTRNGVSNNSLIAAFLEERGTNYDTLKASLTEAMEDAVNNDRASGTSLDGSGTPETRAICLALPGAKDKDEEKRSKKEWYLKKSAKEQGTVLGISPQAHPRLLKAVEEGRIPLSLFHKSGDQLSLVNVEFDLWEKAFEREGWEEVLCSIAQNASGRTTYEKNVTPYIAFLFRIEGYLTRHTEKGKKWRAMPKFIQSEWELEMNEAEEGGTTKRRSALTPIPDNEARTITVPYCAMAISGVRTTYCYSLDYQVFEENTIDRESATPIVNELELKLNNRDDYGLMYYTLTGTPRNTGYPAFLIIFERRKSGTHVHFHRVHPCRSKDGKPTPACRLIEECYRYMAGNVRAEEIYAQQGDLIFIKTEQTVELSDAKGVKEFESHAFKPMEDKPILLIPNETKSIKNRLGFIYSEGMFMVDHPEHEPIRGIPAGMYEVRRCKSWEANPKAVWVLTID